MFFPVSSRLVSLAAFAQARITLRSPAVDSVNTFAEWFFAGFARITGNCIINEDRHAVYDVRIP